MGRAPIYPVTDVVAERELTFTTRAGSFPVVVRHAKPFKNDDDLWICPYEIVGPAWSKRFWMAGCDSTQALTLALQIIPSECNALSRRFGGRFTWLESRSIGFPPVSRQRASKKKRRA